MIAGHFAIAAVAKSTERQVPLWALMLGTAWLDVLFIPLFATGAEKIETAAGASGYGSAVIYADYTHSLVGALVLSGILGGAAALRWGRRTGAVLGFVSFSHWLLDLLVHRADLPVLPGNAGDLPRLGLGLWQMPPLVIAIEAVLVVVGALLYWRAARQTATPARSTAASVAAVALLVSGLAVLAADATGTFG